MRRVTRPTVFTETTMRSGVHPPVEYARMAHEAFTLMGRPEAQVQLEPLSADDGVDTSLAVRVSSLPLGLSIRYARGSSPEDAWPTIIHGVALASDRWPLKAGAACGAVATAALVCADRFGPIKAKLAHMSVLRRSAVLGAIQVGAALIVAPPVLRYTDFRADQLVVDALARSNLNHALGDYVMAISDARNTAGLRPRFGVPLHTRQERFERMRKRIEQKWGLNVYDLCNGTSSA